MEANLRFSNFFFLNFIICNKATFRKISNPTMLAAKQIQRLYFSSLLQSLSQITLKTLKMSGIQV
jgi:hypothetical protein